ncbi:hypothetical protein BH11ARM2_BH11ARM2_25300 [soil metagenome]
MAHSSPFTDAVVSEWDRLVKIGWDSEQGRQPPHEQIEGWKVLYASSFIEEKWCVSAPDAGLIASLGVMIALQESRFEDAVMLAQQYLAHPNALEADKNTWEHMSIYLGFSQILCGRFEEGIDTLDRLLQATDHGRRGRANMIRYHLLWALHDLGEEFPPDPRLSGFIERLLRVMKGQKRKARLVSAAKCTAI